MQKNMLLKVSSILMIIGGALMLLIGLIAVIGASMESALRAPLVMAAIAFVFIIALVELIAGIIGVSTANKGKKGTTCVVLGLIILVVAIANVVVTIISTGSIAIPSLIIGLLLPVIYLIGGINQKNYEAEAPIVNPFSGYAPAVPVVPDAPADENTPQE